jgi:Secretion system C-terminal sorting domain
LYIRVQGISPAHFNSVTMIKKTILAFSFVLAFQNSFCQEWPKVYGSNISAHVEKIIETYDGAYLILLNVYSSPVTLQYGWLIKTDVNGNILWEKKFGNKDDQLYFTDIKECEDNGLILIGATTKYDTDFDPLIVKLNACGELEWCRVIHSAHTYNSGRAIELLDNGQGYLALVRYHGFNVSEERIFLFALDNTGAITWQNIYAQNDPLIWNEEGYGLIRTLDNHFVITGACEYPTIIGGDTTSYMTDRPYFIYVDSLGQQVWDLKWGIDTYSFGLTWQSIEKEPGWFYSACGTNPQDLPVQPVLLKYNKMGEEMYEKYLLNEPDLVGGGVSSFEVFRDTNLVIAYKWRNTYYPVDQGYSMVMKTDTLGNMINKRLLMEQYQKPTDLEITSDNKILVVGSYVPYNKWLTYLWKMNDELEDDSLNHKAITYDSICPYQIVSDTTDCNCLVVNLDEVISNSSKQESWVYPNPATSLLNLDLSQWKGYQNKNLVIYSMQGTKMQSFNIPGYFQSTSVQLPKLTPGLYLVVLYAEDEILEREKVMVNP